MDDLATALEDRGDRVRFAIATADPVAGECLAAPHAALDARWRGHDVPVPPLDVQLRTCERRGMAERAALIRAALRA